MNLSPRGATALQEEPSIDVTAAKSLSNKTITDDQPVITDMHVYKKPSVLDIDNQNPDRVYRYLSRKRIEREGGNRRGWIPIEAGRDKEHIPNSQVNIQEMMEDSGIKNLKEVPQQNRGTGTDIIIGDMQLHYQHKDWAKSREETYTREARQAVQEVTIQDEKDRSAMIEEVLRKSGLSKSETRRYMECSGGAMVMNTGPRR